MSDMMSASGAACAADRNNNNSPSWCAWRRSSPAPTGRSRSLYVETSSVARLRTSVGAAPDPQPGRKQVCHTGHTWHCHSSHSAHNCTHAMKTGRCMALARPAASDQLSTSWPRPLNARLALVGKLLKTSCMPRCSCKALGVNAELNLVMESAASDSTAPSATPL